jgi:hypothetical protein
MNGGMMFLPNQPMIPLPGLPLLVAGKGNVPHSNPLTNPFCSQIKNSIQCNLTSQAQKSKEEKSKPKAKEEEPKKTTKPVLKSILKKSAPQKEEIKSPSANTKKKGKKPIRWVDEEILEKIKVFKLSDEPDCPEISEEEYIRIQNEIKINPNYRIVEDMRLREIHMEKENMNKARDKEKIARETLSQMIPQAFMKSFKEVIKGDDYDFADSFQSEEKNLIKALCSNSLAVNYYKDTDIPIFPKMGEEKMFDFYDEKILKIDNELAPEKPEKAFTDKFGADSTILTNDQNEEKSEVLIALHKFIE